MAFHYDTVDLPLRRFESFPRRALIVSIALVALGALGFVLALLGDAERAWRAYLFNWLLFTSIAQGGVMFAATTVITRAMWARPIRRLALSMVAFLPLSFLLLIPLFFVGDQIFPWVEHAVPAKAAYLNMPFLVVRNVVGLGLLFGGSLLFAYWSLRPDAGLARDAGQAVPGRFGAALTRDWIGQEAEEARATRKLARIAPALALLFAMGMSFVAWDFIMSLEPEWWSTLIGPYYFMAGFLGGIAVTAILAVLYRRSLRLDGVILGPELHDLGKLTFAFCVFWAYLFYSQYIVIWYGQLPIEQNFVIHRFEPPFKWLSVAVLFLLFVAPFFGLLGVAAKKRPPILTTFAGVVLFGLWLERYVLVYPSYYHGADSLPLGWQEILVTLPFAGLFIASLAWFASTFPIVQVWEPLWEPALDERPDPYITAS